MTTTPTLPPLGAHLRDYEGLVLSEHQDRQLWDQARKSLHELMASVDTMALKVNDDRHFEVTGGSSADIARLVQLQTHLKACIRTMKEWGGQLRPQMDQTQEAYKNMHANMESWVAATIGGSMTWPAMEAEMTPPDGLPDLDLWNPALTGGLQPPRMENPNPLDRVQLYS
jgi:hypothetical protein